MFKFRKFKKTSGLGKVPANTMEKKLTVLNYTPIAYQFSADWIKFCRDFPDTVEKTLKKVDVDDLNAAMFHPMVDTASENAVANANWQLANHLHLVRHDRGLLKGQLSRLKALHSDLQQDLKDINDEIVTYKAMR